jgi:hypothetical protein
MIPPNLPRSGIDIRAVAYHEAGHCVVAVLYGRTIRYVTITPGKRQNARGQVMNGRVALRRPKLPQSLEQATVERRGYLLGCYAGMICESAITGKPVDPSTVAADHEAAATMMSAVSTTFFGKVADTATLKEALAALYLETVKLLSSDETWGAVVRIADALISRGTLTGGEVKRLVLQGPSELTPGSPSSTPGVS